MYNINIFIKHMVIYKCIKCDKEFKLKIDFARHINRKFPCKKQGDIYCHKNDIITSIVAINRDKKNEYKCEHCEKLFASKRNMQRHMENNCKIKRQQENEKEMIFNKLMEQFEIQNKKIEKQSKQIEELKKHNDEIERKLDNKQIQIGNNNNIITNNNNITIIAHGRENFDKITENDIIKALIRGTNSVPLITELMHYNDQYPEFQNIYIPNISQKYCMVYDGNDWLLKDNDDTIDSLYATKYGLLEGKFEEFFDKLTISQQNSFKRFIDLNDKADEEDDTDAKRIISGIKHQLKLLLYNKRKIIKIK